MNYNAQSENPYSLAGMTSLTAAQATQDERASFISKTYMHLVGAIAAFVLLEAVLLNLPITEQMVGMMVGTQYGWLVVMGVFMVVSWVANSWALSAVSLPKQYMGLALYVFAQAVITAPLLYFAKTFNPDVIPTAAVATLALFTLMTAIVFITRKDFSFLRSVLVFGFFAATGLIVCAIVFNFALGPVFIYAMIAFACASILYNTSEVLHHYRTTQYVAAALGLFASVVLLFWYVLQLFMSRD